MRAIRWVPKRRIPGERWIALPPLLIARVHFKRLADIVHESGGHADIAIHADRTEDILNLVGQRNGHAGDHSHVIRLRTTLQNPIARIPLRWDVLDTAELGL